MESILFTFCTSRAGLSCDLNMKDTKGRLERSHVGGWGKMFVAWRGCSLEGL